MLITYNTIWNKKQTDNIIAIYRSYPDIYAKYNGDSIKIATYNFVNEDKYFYHPEKIRTCWYVSDYSDIKCKSIETEKDKDKDKVEYTIDYGFTLNENIVVGDYISRSKAKSMKIDVDYEVADFPIAYALMNSKEKVDRSKDSRHFKVSAEQILDAVYKDDKDAKKGNKYEVSFIMAPSEPSSYKDLEKKCDKEDYPKNACICNYVDYYGGDECSIDDVNNYIMKNYDDEYKGKIPSSVKKIYDGMTRNNLKNTWIDHQELYNFAIINLSVQLLGIVLSVVGMVIPGGYAGVGNAL